NYGLMASVHAWFNLLYGCLSLSRGPWLGVTNRYLGLKFMIHGKTHFGWARLTVTVSHKIFGKRFIRTELTGYAYETIPNKPIIAGRTKGPEDEFPDGPQLESPDDLGSGAFVISPISEDSQAASLGVLALGAKGIPLWRRKETLQTSAGGV